MATNHRRPFTVPGDGIPKRALHLLLPLLLLTARCAEAQNNNNNSSSDNNPYFGNANFNPSMAIVIVVLISAFFFLGFFSIYIRQCAGDHSDTIAAARGGAASGRLRRGGLRGLDPAVLETFPTLVYSEVKGLKIGKGTLECAVCLSEFEDDETLRLLPRCSHVFHPDCIDAWLASHVTCPVCRSNLSLPVPVPAAAAEIGAHETPDPEESVHRSVEESAPEHVTIAVEGDPEGGERKAEGIDIARIGSVKRGMMGSRSRARAARFPRSHSTGHSLVQPGENLDRFTLRLPENVRKEIVAAGMLQRTRSWAAFPAVGEGSSRGGYRRGEGSSRAGRSIRLGRSDRWPSFFLRSLSARVPGWAAGRKGEPEGSVKKGEGEGSTKGKFSAVRVPFDCLGGGTAVKSAGYCYGDGESSTAALARV